MNNLFGTINTMGLNLRNLIIYSADFSQLSEWDFVRIRDDIGPRIQYLAFDCPLLDFNHHATSNQPILNYVTCNFPGLTEVDIPAAAGVG